MSARATARHFIDAGFRPVPIPAGSKAPVVKWKDMEFDEADFDDDGNVGLLLGHGQLVDLDVDDVLARTIASLTPLNLATMRSRLSDDPGVRHYWFRATGDVPAFAQYQDPATGHMLVELRSSRSSDRARQTVIPPARHPDGAYTAWLDWPGRAEGEVAPLPDEAEGEVLSQWAAMIASAALLARYWPAEGSRHHAHLALCGALLHQNNGIDEWWSQNLPHFLDWLRRATGDEDRRPNIATTIQAIQDGQTVTGLGALRRHLRVDVVDTLVEWLRIEENEEDEAPVEEWLWTDVTRVRLPIDPPEDLTGDHLLFAGENTTIVTRGGKGKTWLALALMGKAMEKGHNVLYVDYENGPDLILRRWQSLGWYEDPLASLLEQRFRHTTSSIDFTSGINAERIMQVVEHHDIQLVVFDAVAGMLSAAQLEENDNGHYTALHTSVIHRLKQAGVTSLTLDHSAKGEESIGGRGASSKFDNSSVVFGVGQSQPFSHEQAGFLELKVQKQRLGEVPPTVRATFQPRGKDAFGVHRLDITVQTVAELTVGNEDDRIAKALLDELERRGRTVKTNLVNGAWEAMDREHPKSRLRTVLADLLDKGEVVEETLGNKTYYGLDN